MSKKIVLCFDGTCNDPEDAKQGRNLKFELKDSSITNIFKLHLLLGGEPERGKHAFKDQLCFYYPGVGTYGHKLHQLFNAALALPNQDVGHIIRNAAKDLSESYNDGDEVFLFGFSRGAAIARRFAAVVNENVRRYRADCPEIRIRFLAVFDTVASIGLPNLDDDKKPVSDVVFENCTVAHSLDEALHMVSIDEKRTAFMPTLMAYDSKRVTEIWFAGAHSDIGGGFRYDGLSDITLDFLLNELTLRRLGLRMRTPTSLNFGSSSYRKIGLAYDDMAIQPNPLGRIHQQNRIWLLRWTLSDRDLRVHVEEEKPSDPVETYPLVHYTVVERINGDRDYRPVSLSRRSLHGKVENQVPHRIWRPDGGPYQVVMGLEEHLRKGPPAPKKFAVGQSRLVTVYANQKFNRSYIQCNRGEEYTFSVDMNQTWFDSGIACGPDGWDRASQDFPWYQDIPIKFMEDERRCPEANWFEITGIIGRKDQKPFRVLHHLESMSPLSIDRPGEMFLFANDLEDRYSNNLGFIQVLVKRIK